MKSTGKFFLIGLILVLASGVIFYFLSKKESPEELVSKYPGIKALLTSLRDYSVQNGRTLAQDINAHLKWSKTPRNAEQSPARAAYSAAINYDPNVALRHAKILGII